MVTISLPDGSKESFDKIPTGFDIAGRVSNGTREKYVAYKIEDRLFDLSASISKDSEIALICSEDEEALGILRHSAAHVMAQAILRLYPNAKLAIGPAVKDGFYYDVEMEPISEDDFGKIEAEMKKIIDASFDFQRLELPRTEATALLEAQKYKKELISELEEDSVSFYRQGDFTDLCRGPHLPNTSLINAFKLMKVSGAYWRADPKNAQLQRIYGTAFFEKKEQDKYLTTLEEAKNRDHRKIGPALDLFSFHDEAPGMPFFHPYGVDVWNSLLDYWREEHRAAGYYETKTPILLNKGLWERSGHWDNYRENMYITMIGETDYALKPMNCPGGMILFAQENRSYRDLPYRASEIGLVHRHELSGALAGLFRVRAFHQDDAHIFMTPEQISDEILGVLHLSERIYNTFGLKFHLELSTKPKKHIGSEEQWEKTTNALRQALDHYGRDYKINEGDGAFYGPKIDSHIEDVLGRTWQCGTIQLDMSLPERFDLSYIGNDSKKHRPLMIHRTIFGSIERFLGIIIEHFAGAFPVWMAPVQTILLPLSDEVEDYSAEVKRRLEGAGIRTEEDARTERLSRKVRDAQLRKIPFILTLGAKEKASGSLSVRTLNGCIQHGIPLETFVNNVLDGIRKRTLIS